MHDERRIAAERGVALGPWRRHVVRRLVAREVRRVESGPALGHPVPPDQLFALAPRRAVRFCRGTVVEDAAIRGPGESPTVAVRAGRLAFARPVAAWRGIHAGVDPASAGSAAVRGQAAKAVDERPRDRRTPVDLLEHGVDVWFAVRARGGVVPRQRVQPSMAKTWLASGARLEPAAEMVDEPGFAARVPGRIDRLVAPLQQTLRVREAAFLLGVSGRGEEEDLGGDRFGSAARRARLPENPARTSPSRSRPCRARPANRGWPGRGVRAARWARRRPDSVPSRTGPRGDSCVDHSRSPAGRRPCRASSRSASDPR